MLVPAAAKNPVPQPRHQRHHNRGAGGDRPDDRVNGEEQAHRDDRGDDRDDHLREVPGHVGLEILDPVDEERVPLAQSHVLAPERPQCLVLL